MTAVQIPAAVYLDRYDKACRHGYTDVVTVTAGSSFMTTWRAADQARALFYAQHPDAQLRIHVIDSKRIPSRSARQCCKRHKRREKAWRVLISLPF